MPNVHATLMIAEPPFLSCFRSGGQISRANNHSTQPETRPFLPLVSLNRRFAIQWFITISIRQSTTAQFANLSNFVAKTVGTRFGAPGIPSEYLL
jgi:hypothetical protein